MSIKATAWAISARTRTPMQKLLLLLMANAADDEGFCDPSISTMAINACASRQGVVQNIKKLASQGFIGVTQRTFTDSRTGKSWPNSNLYHLNIGVVNEVDKGDSQD